MGFLPVVGGSLGGRHGDWPWRIAAVSDNGRFGRRAWWTLAVAGSDRYQQRPWQATSLMPDGQWLLCGRAREVRRLLQTAVTVVGGYDG